jgi:hypothetical protein
MASEVLRLLAFSHALAIRTSGREGLQSLLRKDLKLWKVAPTSVQLETKPIYFILYTLYFPHVRIRVASDSRSVHGTSNILVLESLQECLTASWCLSLDWQYRFPYQNHSSRKLKCLHQIDGESLSNVSSQGNTCFYLCLSHHVAHSYK